MAVYCKSSRTRDEQTMQHIESMASRLQIHKLLALPPSHLIPLSIQHNSNSPEEPMIWCDTYNSDDLGGRFDRYSLISIHLFVSYEKGREGGANVWIQDWRYLSMKGSKPAARKGFHIFSNWARTMDSRNSGRRGARVEPVRLLCSAMSSLRDVVGLGFEVLIPQPIVFVSSTPGQQDVGTYRRRV